MSELTISSSPVDAIMPGAAIVVGVEEDRLYLGTRYKHTHVHVAEEHREEIERAWRSSFMGHLFCRGWKQEDICSDRHEVSDGETSD